MVISSSTRLRTVAIILLVLFAAYAVIAVLPAPKNYKGENVLLKDGEAFLTL